MSQIFTLPDTWAGGFYELALAYGPSRGNSGLEKAIQAVWNDASLIGCYLDKSQEPQTQSLVRPSLAQQEADHILGIAKLPNGKSAACGTWLLRFEDGWTWLDFYLPLGSLAHAISDIGGFPFDESDAASERWRVPIESWLATMAMRVYSEAPYDLGIIGFEVCGDVEPTEVLSQGVPTVRTFSYLYSQGNQLTWYPTNRWHPQPLPAS